MILSIDILMDTDLATLMGPGSWSRYLAIEGDVALSLHHVHIVPSEGIDVLYINVVLNFVFPFEEFRIRPRSSSKYRYTDGCRHLSKQFHLTAIACADFIGMGAPSVGPYMVMDVGFNPAVFLSEYLRTISVWNQSRKCILRHMRKFNSTFADFPIDVDGLFNPCWPNSFIIRFVNNPYKVERLAEIEHADWKLFAEMSIPNAMAAYRATVEPALVGKYRYHCFRKGLCAALTGLIPMIVASGIGENLLEELSIDPGYAAVFI